MIYLHDLDYFLAADHVYVNRSIVEDSTTFHAHNFIEIAYVSSGQGIHIIGDQTYSVRSGSITVINYDVPHAFQCTEEPLDVYNCVFTPVFLDYMLSNSRSLLDVCNHFLLGRFYQGDSEKAIVVEAPEQTNLAVRDIYLKMLEEINRKDIGYREIIRGYLINLLITVFRLGRGSGGQRQSELAEAVDYIRLHYMEPIFTRDLARKFSFSETAFCRKFKEMTGMTVTDFIQTLRIEEACKQLAATNDTVETIANRVGYHDMKHFYNIFRKMTAKLPRDFRVKR